MKIALANPDPAPAAAPPAPSFVSHLVRQFRDQGACGECEAKTDAEVLDTLVRAPTLRGQLPAGEPDPEVFWRIELFFSAAGAAIEQRTGIVCAPMLKMYREGFGRLVLLAGRLVVLNRYLRDVHRFGFESIEKLAEAGEQLVQEGVAAIERYRHVATYR